MRRRAQRRRRPRLDAVTAVAGNPGMTFGRPASLKHPPADQESSAGRRLAPPPVDDAGAFFGSLWAKSVRPLERVTANRNRRRSRDAGRRDAPRAWIDPSTGSSPSPPTRLAPRSRKRVPPRVGHCFDDHLRRLRESGTTCPRGTCRNYRWSGADVRRKRYAATGNRLRVPRQSFVGRCLNRLALSVLGARTTRRAGV